jgi:hypothetical protein
VWVTLYFKFRVSEPGFILSLCFQTNSSCGIAAYVSRQGWLGQGASQCPALDTPKAGEYLFFLFSGALRQGGGMSIQASEHLKPVVGLVNDIVHQVFSCPECKTEVTVSRWQVAGELAINCARCNARWQVKGTELLDLNVGQHAFQGLNVFVKLDEIQKNPPKAKPAAGGPAAGAGTAPAAPQA